MKLVKQITLVFRKGTSDKVYEVDLCEVGPGRYLVNFRYGRRGSALREGTKTKSAVGLAEAERIYDKLVNSKTSKGYTESGSATGDETEVELDEAEVVPRVPGEVGSREQAILDVLGGPTGRAARHRLDRAVWRAGELRLREAEPLLLRLARRRSSDLSDYCLAFALGRCGTPGSNPTREAISTIGERTEMARSVAREAWRGLCEDEDLEAFVRERLAELPNPLVEPAREGPPEAFAEALRGYLQQPSHRKTGVLELLYLIDGEVVRPALLETLRNAPLRVPYFVRFRRLFKMAELRQDPEVFGVIAHRFETSRHTFSWIWNRRQLKGPNAKKAFGKATRNYFRRRTWRTLRRLGQLGDPAFVRMAVGTLLPFTDSDGGQVRRRTSWDWRSGRRSTQYWDTFSSFWAFNHILYGGRCNRYEAGRHVFRCKGRYQPGGAEPRQREEAFPRLWDAVPGALLHLIDGSRCERVHRFAVRALRANKAFLDELDEEVCALLLAAPYEVSAAFGLEVLRRNFPGQQLSDELLVALVDSPLEEARREGFRRIETRRSYVLGRSELIAGLVTSRQAETRAFARTFLQAAELSEDAARLIVGRLMARLEGLSEEAATLAQDVVETLSACFGAQLRVIGMSVVRDLLGHELIPLVALGGEILAARQEAGMEVDLSVILRLVESEHAELRRVGAKLVGGMPLELLVEHEALLVSLATSAHADMREAVGPGLARVGRSSDRELAYQVAHALLRALLVKKQPEGVHTGVLELLKGPLRPVLSEVPSEVVWALLQAGAPQAQELGGLLLASNVDLSTLSVRQVVKLANHAIRAVRQAAWKAFEENLDRMRQGMHVAVQILDADWDDTREWSFAFFRERLAEELTPAVLVSICDSTKPLVQQLGRELITARFQEEHGEEYLLKLSEHPAQGLQTFATNYLERYAADEPAKLRQLELYFLTVLSRVNTGRVAKDRVLAFLEAEALKNAEAAAIVAGIFTRQSLTVAIGDKATMIRAMLRMRAAHPDLELPIRPVPVPVRGEPVEGAA